MSRPSIRDHSASTRSHEKLTARASTLCERLLALYRGRLEGVSTICLSFCAASTTYARQKVSARSGPSVHASKRWRPSRRDLVLRAGVMNTWPPGAARSLSLARRTARQGARLVTSWRMQAMFKATLIPSSSALDGAKLARSRACQGQNAGFAATTNASRRDTELTVTLKRNSTIAPEPPRKRNWHRERSAIVSHGSKWVMIPVPPCTDYLTRPSLSGPICWMPT